MGVAGDLLLVLGGVLLVAFTPLEFAFATLVVFWLLVPGTLVVPHAPHFFLVCRTVLYAFGLRLLIRRGPREPNASAYRFTLLHGALAVLLVVGFLDGVAFTPRDTGLAGALYGWASILDVPILFVLLIAVIRTITPRRAISIIAIVLAVAVIIGFCERFWFHQGWAHFFFEGVPAKDLGAGDFPLATRGGSFRSQVASQFALEYGWVLAMLLPLSVLAAMQWSRRGGAARLGLLLPLLTAVAIVFSGSRGPEVAAVVAMLLFVLFAGGRQLARWGIGAGALAVLFAIADPSFITNAFAAADDPASVRLQRLGPLFALVVHRPFTGLGLNSLSAIFGGLDDGYAMIYATLGMLGVLAWLTVIVVALAIVARTITAPRGTEVRMVGAACLVGILVVAVAISNYDLVNTPQSSWAFVFLAALGSTVAGTVPRFHHARRGWLKRSLLPIAGAGIGVLVLAISPLTATENLSAFTESPNVAASGGVSSGYALVNTLCPVVTNSDVLGPHAKVTCLQGSSVFPTDYAGLALVTVTAPNSAAVSREVSRAFDPLRNRMLVVVTPNGTIQTGRPAWAVTAPLSGGVAGVLAMFLIPSFRRRRAVPDQIAQRPSDNSVRQAMVMPRTKPARNDTSLTIPIS